MKIKSAICLSLAITAGRAVSAEQAFPYYGPLDPREVSIFAPSKRHPRSCEGYVNQSWDPFHKSFMRKKGHLVYGLQQGAAIGALPVSIAFAVLGPFVGAGVSPEFREMWEVSDETCDFKEAQSWAQQSSELISRATSNRELICLNRKADMIAVSPEQVGTLCEPMPSPDFFRMLAYLERVHKCKVQQWGGDCYWGAPATAEMEVFKELKKRPELLPDPALLNDSELIEKIELIERIRAR